MEYNDGEGTDALELLSQGFEISIVVGMKPMFDKIIQGLDLPSPPVFTTIECGDAGVRVSIKLDVSNLQSANGQRIWYSVVEGETMASYPAAQDSAIKRALKLLEVDHLIRIVDFSAMVAQRVDGNHTNELLSGAIGALENVLVQWDMTVGNCVKFIADLEEKESHDNIFAGRSPRGRVYGFLSDCLTDIRNSFYNRTNAAKTGLTEAQDELTRYQNILQENGGNANSNQAFHDVSLPSKYILEYVMCFLGLKIPHYVSSPGGHGFVKSTVVINFPYMENFQFGGDISLEGKAYTSAQADEEAAYEALLFIEENFHTKVVDYNYSKRKKALEDQNSLSEKLSNILELADSVKMMFGELITAIEGQRRQFNFDPSLFFAGRMSGEQIDAFLNRQRRMNCGRDSFSPKQERRRRWKRERKNIKTRERK